MAGSLSSRHHFVPEWYLKRFCDSSGRLWVYDKALSRVRTPSPKQVCYYPNRYNSVAAVRLNDDLEKRIYGSIDQRHAPAFNNLEGTCNPSYKWSHEQIIVLDEFVSQTFWRSPGADPLYQYLKRTGQLHFEAGTFFGAEKVLTHDAPSSALEFMFTDHYDEHLKPALHYAAIGLGLIHGVGQDLHWETQCALPEEGAMFLTSDRPLNWVRPPRATLDVAQEVEFAISPWQRYFRKTHGEELSHIQYSDLHNALQFIEANRFVIANSRNLLKRVLQLVQTNEFSSAYLRHWLFSASTT